MNAILLLPACISLILVLRGKIEIAFISVYLPSLLMLPEGYAIRLPHLPPVSAAEYALIPIGIAALIKFIRSGSIVIMDVLILAFMVSIACSEVLRENVMNDGIFSAMVSFVSVVLAYVTGRVLIEPELRLPTVKRIVILLLLLAPVGLFEWRMAQNIYGIVGSRLQLSDVLPTVQIRSGRGRMGAAFTDAEIAGIAMCIGVSLNGWLAYLGRLKNKVRIGTWLARFEKYHLPGILLLGCVFLTQSRGPMGAAVVAVLVLLIPRFKNSRIATVVIGIVILAAAAGAFTYLTHVANSIDPTAIQSEQEGSTLYRSTMNRLYLPIADKGGWLGWSLMGIPHIPGLLSIDNHFLLVYLAQGKFGLIVLVLITAESLRTLVMRSWRIETMEDRAFVFSMLAAMTALWFSLLTVYMGEQLPQLVFLLIGWSQSITATPHGAIAQASVSNAREPLFDFRRVFQ